MFGLTFEKLLLIGVIAVLIVGPDRLPAAAARFAQFIRSLRDLADGAKTRMRDELGPEYDDIDWKKLDPRQYDPRRIIREALTDDSTTSSVTPVTSPARASGAKSAPAKRRSPARDAQASTPFDAEST
ncbi:MAG: twin-arginine translocase TatA/TatE family subunit [Actinobacteria bacterium]|nr:twin-arginine translocase TatA/TatE family subunit [Actinomycetota bacterium]